MYMSLSLYFVCLFFIFINWPLPFFFNIAHTIAAAEVIATPPNVQETAPMVTT